MDVLEVDDISYDDFGSLLLNPDEMKSYFTKLKESCNKFHAKIDRSILESISKSSECAMQVEKSSETILQLSNQKKELKAAIENFNLEQKVVEKKAINTIREINKIKAEIESVKEKKEKLLLEIVDLEQESQKSKQYMKKQWDAVKKACSIYKNLLDIHINSEMIDHIEHVTVKFFWTENPTDKIFFVILTYQDNCWKVKKIEPELSMENKYQLNHVVQFSKQSEVANVTSLLCELRNLFLKNYF